jgi:hypothetical protein
VAVPRALSRPSSRGDRPYAYQVACVDWMNV